jgi:hypothetical protein
MKLHSTKSGMTLAAVCAFVAATGVVVFRAQADQWDKKTVLTVNQPIQISDTYLEPGTYVLKLLDSSSDRHIVQIFNRDQNHLINTVMAIPNYRLEPTGNSRFMFWETPPGSARAMRAWFYPGDNFGQEFRYPKQLRQLASLTTVETKTRVEEAPAPAPVAEPAPAPEPEAQAVVQEPAHVEEQAREEVIIAQNTPPPPPAEPAPAPAAAPAPEELPKTATPYPVIGLSGLFSLGLYGLLRLKRSA